MRNIIVLGAGRGQIPLIDLFHRYGCHVCVVSPRGDYPGFKTADESFYCDIRERERILKYAQEKNICGITSDQLDEGVLTAAYISEKLNLRGITSDVALKFTNKFEMRKAAIEAGIDVPLSVCVKSAIEGINYLNSYIHCPAIMKPVDSSASRGVYKIDNPLDIEKYFSDSLSYSMTGKVIIEQFIKGREYVIEAYTHEHKTYNLIIGNREYFNIPDVFIPNATVFCDADSATSHLETRLKKANNTLIKQIGLPFGITHAEFMHDEETDKIYLVEIAARGGGVFISSDLIPAACGINANDLLVKDILGIRDLNTITLKKGASAYFCYLTPPGQIKSIEGIKDVNAIHGVRKAFFDNVTIGMHTKEIRDKSSRKGPILVQGEKKEDCYRVLNEIRNKLEIKVLTKNGIKEIIWQ